MPPAGEQSKKEGRSSLPLVPPEVSDGEEQRYQRLQEEAEVHRSVQPGQQTIY
jgi:hypothetical protein